MLLLRKATSNRIVVTLHELRSESLPNNWLFVFSLDQSLGDAEYTYRIQLTDVSTNPDDYNQFTLVEGVDLTIPLTGDYLYKVYQMPDAVSLDETQGVLVETGKMKLTDVADEIPTYLVASNTSIYE